MMWKASSDHTLPSLIPFHSLQVLPLQHSDWLEPRSSCWGESPGESPVEALQFHTTIMSHWSSGLTICPATGGNGLRPGSTTHTLELGLPISAVSLQQTLNTVGHTVDPGSIRTQRCSLRTVGYLNTTFLLLKLGYTPTVKCSSWSHCDHPLQAPLWRHYNGVFLCFNS